MLGLDGFYPKCGVFGSCGSYIASITAHAVIKVYIKNIMYAFLSSYTLNFHLIES